MEQVKRWFSYLLAVSMLFMALVVPTAQAQVQSDAPEKFMHMSFDDVYASLKDITQHEYNSVFENALFGDLKRLHDEYGAVFTLNCFLEGDGFRISDLPSRYQKELGENAGWLKFAFHAKDKNQKYTEDCPEDIEKDYQTFIDAVLNLTGTARSIDHMVRLGFFTGSSSNIDALRACEEGITGLLTADDDRVSYYFSEEWNDYILKSNEYYDLDKNLRLIRTQTRLENIKTDAAQNAEFEKFAGYDRNVLEVFTHESEYSKVKARLENYVKWASENGYGFDFAENHLPNLISVTDTTVSGGDITYQLKVDAGGLEETKLICASYAADGRLEQVSVKGLDEPLSFRIKESADARAAFLLWNSLGGMIPLSQVLSVPRAVSQTSAIMLDRYTYPLVVGNASKTDFSKWEDQGSYVTITATVNDANYKGSDITWTVENPDIAYDRNATTASGQTSSASFRGRTTGFTRVIAKLPNGETTACAITVIDNITRSTVQRLELNTTKLELGVGADSVLIPIINPKDIFENGAMDCTVNWSSSDTSVAAVDANGKVTAKKQGNAVITATSNDVGRTASCQVNVIAQTPAVDVISGGTDEIIEMTAGEKTSLQDYIDSSDSEIVWNSSDSYIADVDENGMLSAYANSRRPRVKNDQVVFENGEYVYDPSTIDVYATAVETGKTLTFRVQVEEPERKAQSVKINKESVSVPKGQTKTITAAVLPAPLYKKDVAWSSSDESVAKIVPGGRTIYGLCKADITGVGEGSATITAECDGKTDTCVVTVTNGVVKISQIDLSDQEIEMDEVLKLEAGTTANATDSTLAWIVTDRNIATINNEGVVQGYQAGSVKVYAVAKDSVADETALKALTDTRTIGEDNADLASFLSGVVYKEITLTVADSSIYLRNLHAPKEAVTDTSVNLLWNKSSNAYTGEMTYEVYANGALVDTTNKMGYTIKGLSPFTEYTIEVKAADSSGNTVASQSITVTTKPASTVLNVLDYGAEGSGTVTDTLAIQKAIDECPVGGTVYLPKGYIFYSGALFLHSDMTLKVDGTLIGSVEGKDYPLMVTRWEGWRKIDQSASEWENTSADYEENHYSHSSLITTGTYDEGDESYTGPFNVENLVICGEGQINGNGFKLGYNEGPNRKDSAGGQPVPMTPAYDYSVRGRLLSIHNTSGLYVSDLCLAYGPSWTVNAYYSEHMTYDGLDIVSKGNGKTGAADDICILNGDGIDPDSSTNVNIFDTFFYAGDDSVAVKSGRNKEGNDLDKPSAYIRITDCTTQNSKGGFVLGSEIAGGTHDILMQNLTATGITLSYAYVIKTDTSRGGINEDIVYRDCKGDKRFECFYDHGVGTTNPATKTPVKTRYLTFENCNFSITARGTGSNAVEGITIIAGNQNPSGTLKSCKNVVLWDCDESRFTMSDSSDIRFYKTGQFEDTAIILKGSAGIVREIDNDAHTITVIDIAKGIDVKNEITSVLGGMQGYAFFDGEVELGDNEVLKSGNLLKVTSQDGEHSAEYTIVTEESEIAYQDTGIRIKEGAQNVIQTTDAAVCAVQGATAAQLKDEIESVYGFEQTYTVSLNETQLENSDALTDECILTVTSPNGEATKNYAVKIALVWDFSEFAEEVKTTESGFAYDYAGLSIAIANNGADSDHDKISKDGVYWRGGAKSGESPRYIEFIAPENGTFKVTGRIYKNDGRWGLSQSKDVATMKADGSSSTNTSFTEVSLECTAGTPYYVINKTRAAEVQKLMFVPDMQ